MKRKIYNKLLEWKEQRNGATAVLIEGARRIGKSYIVEEFARNEYDSYLLIDFNKADKVVWTWFDTLLEDLDTLLMNLQIHYGTRLTPGKSVVVFDEVQLCPRARAAINIWWPTVGSIILKQVRLSASRKTCVTLSSLPKRRPCRCSQWILRNFFGLLATTC